MVQLTKENLIYIGASGTIAVAALALIGSSIFSGATTEGLEIGETSIKKASGNAVITIQVKNVGTSQIEDVAVSINGVELGTTGVNLATPDSGLSNSAVDRTGTPATIPSGGPSVVCNPCTLTFEDVTRNLDAGQSTSYSATIPGSDDEFDVGESFVITVEGIIDGSSITNTAVATVTRF